MKHIPAMRKTVPEMKRQYEALVRLSSGPYADDERYMQHAIRRGWETFRHLPEAAPGQTLLDVGSAGGIFASSYVEVWGYEQVTLLGYDVPAGGTLTHQGSEGRTHVFPTANANIEIDPWPVADASFDVVVCTEVLEHLIFDPLFALNEMCRVLKPGGGALITVPNAASDACLVSLINDRQPGFLRHYISDALKSGARDLGTVYNLGHFHEYTGPELRAVAQAAGFAVDTLCGISAESVQTESGKCGILLWFTRALFPRSKRVKEPNLLMLARKESYTPLEHIVDRYPAPLYRPL